MDERTKQPIDLFVYSNEKMRYTDARGEVTIYLEWDSLPLWKNDKFLGHTRKEVFEYFLDKYREDYYVAPTFQREASEKTCLMVVLSPRQIKR